MLLASLRLLVKKKVGGSSRPVLSARAVWPRSSEGGCLKRWKFELTTTKQRGRKVGNEDDLASVLNIRSGSPILYTFKQEFFGNSVKEYSLL